MILLSRIRMAIARFIFPAHEVISQLDSKTLGDCDHKGSITPAHVEISNKQEYPIYEDGKRIGTSIVARVIYFDHCKKCGTVFVKYTAREPVAYYTGVRIKGDANG